MATYLWSTLVNGQSIATFDPASDVLRFDDPTISAASIVLTGNSAVAQATFAYGGKSVSLGMNWLSITTTNITFVNGSLLLVGDNTIGIVNDDGNNTLTGGTGNDQLLGMGGDDTYIGGAGDDVFILAATNHTSGNDTVNGGPGVDRIYLSGDPTATVLFAGVERIIGTSSAETFTGSSSVALIFDGAGGNDSFVGASANGIDTTVAYETATSGVTVNLGTGTASDGLGGTDMLVNIDGVEGSRFNDVITGGSNSRDATGALFEFFQGMAGNDTIDGAGGTDRVDYTNSPAGVIVDLNLGTAQDGWGGTDTLISIEQVRGSAFADTLLGGAGDDFFEGMAGNDTIDGRGGFDEVSYQSATAAVSVNLGTGVGQARAGDAGVGVDSLVNIEAVRGSDFDDLLVGGAGNERFEGRRGNDTIVGGGGTDTVSFLTSPGAVNVNLQTGVAADGYGTTDSISQVANVLGSNFADVLVGDGGNNVLSGGLGNDTFTGGLGNDTITGGMGVDTAIFSGAISAYTVTINGLTVTVAGADGTDTITGVERLSFSDSLWTLPSNSRVDHNLDGKTDLIWRNSDGTVATWGMNDSQFTAHNLAVADSSWSIIDGHGDYNGDGKSDLLWRNSNGAVAMWTMNDAQFTNNSFGMAHSSWSIIDGHADYNGDGKGDLLWRNSNGSIATWMMDGAQHINSSFAMVDSSWSIIDSHGDYNGDGKSDLLWRNSNGSVATWMMNGSQFTNNSFGMAHSSWSIIDGHGDYNGDGKSDLLWRNTDGRIATWMMDGSQFTNSSLAMADSSWSIIDGHGDYNGDGKSDLLWRNTDGRMALWTMDGSQFTNQSLGVVVDSSWSIMDGHGDYNADGKSDLLWRNTDGRIATWTMDGSQFTNHSLNTLPSSWSIVDAAEMGTTVNGDNGDNILQGTVGRDTFYPGAGNDTITGGAGADQVVFNTALNAASNVDTITDFTPGTDKLLLSEVVFGSVPTGVLNPANFVAEPGAVAHDANDFILYNTTTGAVSYDADGTGAQAPIMFAMLTNHPILTAQDVHVGII